MARMNDIKYALQQLTDLIEKNMANTFTEGDEFDWNVRMEIMFLHSMFGLKPVGVNRFFVMREIHSKFTKVMRQEIPTHKLWDRLDTMYDMQALNESECLPFPNEEMPFELNTDFDDMVKDRFGITLYHTPKEEDLNRAPSNSKEYRRTPKFKQTMTSASSAKNTFLTPGAVKSSKSSDSRSPSIESTPKASSESLLSSKSGKVKHATSPFASKNIKSESSSTVREENMDVSSTKKSSKVENNSSTKKTPKSEPSTGSGSAKKYTKHSDKVNAIKVKTEVSEGSGKKFKPELTGKKEKVFPTPENSKKNSKVDGRRVETDYHRKSIDTTSQKIKSERNSSSNSKSSKQDELDSSHLSGSKKQSLGKVDVNDKKTRRSKIDDSAKKVTPAAKRRRI